MSDRLDALLVAVGQDLDWPEVDVAQAVAVRIRSAPVPVRRMWLPRLAFAAATVVVLVAGTLVFSPATRRAVADFLGIGGVRIQFGTPSATPEIGSDLDLGHRIPLESAEAGVGFEVVMPRDPILGEPDEVYLAEFGRAGGLLSFVYGPRPGLPATGDSEVAVLFTQFASPLAPLEFFGKKLASEGTIVELVEVNGNEGYWLEGEPHFFYYEDPGVGLIEERIRLVGNVLLWEQDGVTLRLEVGDLSSQQALEIAATVN